MLAKDIMRKNVITIDRYQTAQELADLLRERCISGVPVLDEEGRVVGVVSTTDLLRAKRPEDPSSSDYHLWPEGRTFAAPPPIEASAEARVDTLMTPGALAFPEDTPVAKLAEAMLDLHVHRLLITRAGKLCGIVSSMDMLKALVPKPERRRTVHR